MKFEVALVPVSDVDHTKEFYTKLGWRLDEDVVMGNDFRVVQFTPPGFRILDLVRQGVTAAPGSFRGGLSGPDPERQSYRSYLSFEDPDGNACIV